MNIIQKIVWALRESNKLADEQHALYRMGVSHKVVKTMMEPSFNEAGIFLSNAGKKEDEK